MEGVTISNLLLFSTSTVFAVLYFRERKKRIRSKASIDREVERVTLILSGTITKLKMSS